MRYNYLMLILIFIPISSVNAQGGDENWAHYESTFARLSVYPNLSCAVPSHYYEQTAYLWNKRTVDQSFNFSFQFNEQLTYGYFQIRVEVDYGNGSIGYEWNDITSQIEHLEWNDKHYYYRLNNNIKANNTTVVRFAYKTDSVSGKWDLLLWTGELQNYDFLYRLDPYYSQTGSGDESTEGLMYYALWGHSNTSTFSDWQDGEGVFWDKRIKITLSNKSGALFNYSSSLQDLFVLKSDLIENQARIVFYNDSDYFEIPTYAYNFNTSHLRLIFYTNYSVINAEEVGQNKTMFYLYYYNRSASNRAYYSDASEFIDSDLLAWWTCDYGSGTTLYDQLESYDGIFKGAGEPAWNTTEPLFSESFVSFDGSNDYLDFDSLDDVITGSNDYTFTIWIRRRNNITGTQIWFGDIEDTGNSREVYMDFVVSSNSWRINLDRVGNENQQIYTTNSIGAGVGVWYHVSFVFDYDTSATVYVDGEIACSGSVSGGPGDITSTRHLMLGRDWHNGAYGSYVSFDMADFKVYQRALTQQELQTLSNPVNLEKALGNEQLSPPNITVNSSYNFGDVVVSDNYSVTITFENHGLSDALITTYDSNSTDYSSNLSNILVKGFANNVSYVFFMPSMYYDENLTCQIEWITNVSNVSSILTGLSSTPYFNVSRLSNSYPADYVIDTEYNSYYKICLNSDSPNILNFTYLIDNETLYNQCISRFIDSYYSVNDSHYPVFLANFSLETDIYSSDAMNIYYKDKYLFVYDSADSTIVILNCTNEMNITIANDTISGIKWSDAKEDALYCNNLAASGNISIYNISTPYLPEYVNDFTLPSTGAYFVKVSGDYLFLSTTNKFHVVNITDPFEITYIGNYTDCEGIPKDFEVSDDIVYVVIPDHIIIFNLTDLTAINNLTEYNTSLSISAAYRCVYNSDTLFVSDDIYGLVMLNVSNITDVVLFDVYFGGLESRVSIDGDNLYLMDTDNKALILCDISDLNSVTEVRRIGDVPRSADFLMTQYTLFVVPRTGGEVLQSFSTFDNCIIINISTTMTEYINNYTVQFTPQSNTSYGNITNGSVIIYYTCPIPVLTNVKSSYNGSQGGILPEDNISFNFSINNTNLNTIAAKYYIWTLSDCRLISNFSELVSSQYSYNSTEAVIQVLREISSFGQEIQNVTIMFYGIGSQYLNNIFNLTIYPNWTDINYSCVYPILTSFSDCEIVTDYSESWTVYNDFGEGGVDFDIITREDTWIHNTTEYNNIGNSVEGDIEIALDQLYKIEFYATAYQAELWLNLKRTGSTNLELYINSPTETTTVTSISSSYETYHLYISGLTPGEVNYIKFELETETGDKIYIQNATLNSDITVKKFNSDIAVRSYETVSYGFAIDILMSELIMSHEVPKYFETQDNLTINSESSNTWNLYYYPSEYTEGVYYSAINFVIVDTNSRRYLDNFTIIISTECLREAYIISNMNDLQIEVYANTDNEFNITFENIGNINATIVNITLSLSWISANPADIGKSLNIGEERNITFSTSDIDTDYIGESFVLTVGLTTTNSGSYTNWMYIDISYIPQIEFINPVNAILEVNRNAGDTTEVTAIIKQIGPIESWISIMVQDPQDENDHNQLYYDGFTLIMDEDEQETLTFIITGSEILNNETWIINICYNDIIIANLTIIVNTEEEEGIGSWIYTFLLVVVAILIMIAALYVRYKFNKKNKEDKKEDTFWNKAKITSRKMIVGTLIFVVLLMIIFALYYYPIYKGTYEPPWEPFEGIL